MKLPNLPKDELEESEPKVKVQREELFGKTKRIKRAGRKSSVAKFLAPTLN